MSDALTIAGDAPAALSDPGVARFRRNARWVIIAIMILFSAGTLLWRATYKKDDQPDAQRIVGETYTNVFLYFGEPQSEESDGQGGQVMHYDEFQVIGDHFEKREFRVYVNADGRVYRFERD